MRLTAAYIGWVGVVMTIARTRGAAAGDEHDDDDPSPSPGYRPLPLTPTVEEPRQPLFHEAASYQQSGPRRAARRSTAQDLHPLERQESPSSHLLQKLQTQTPKMRALERLLGTTHSRVSRTVEPQIRRRVPHDSLMPNEGTKTGGQAAPDPPVVSSSGGALLDYSETGWLPLRFTTASF